MFWTVTPISNHMTMATVKKRAILVLSGSQGDVFTAGHLGKQAFGKALVP
jgi:hypothetical protein